MKQADHMLRSTASGKDEIWYSKEYIEEQIELAHMAGLAYGARISFNAVEPCNKEEVDRCVAEFWRIINEEYQKRFNSDKIKH